MNIRRETRPQSLARTNISPHKIGTVRFTERAVSLGTRQFVCTNVVWFDLVTEEFERGMLNQILWTIDNELEGGSFEQLCIDLLY